MKNRGMGFVFLLVFLCGMNLPAAESPSGAVAPEAVSALRHAIDSLMATFGCMYERGPEFLNRLEKVKTAAEFSAFQREVLLTSPLLEFDRVLLVRRGGNQPDIPVAGPGAGALRQRLPCGNEIAVLTVSTGKFSTIFKPQDGRFIGDVYPDFYAAKMLFSMQDDQGRWLVWQINADGTGLCQIAPTEPRIDQYGARYLPDGGILFKSTAAVTGVPGPGKDMVGNLFRMDADGKNIRRLCFDAEENGNTAILDDGRVLYACGEPGTIPRLFTMNPDGAGKVAYNGKRGFGPTIESGATDPATANAWPKFRDPHPLNDDFFLISGTTAPDAPWGIWLADVFGNRLPLCELPGQSLLEPQPLRSKSRPPVIPSRVKAGEKMATVRIADLYAAAGLAGVPRGTAKKLRVIARHVAYPGMSGRSGVSVNGSPDVLRILGTVPVKDDDSALFQVPANTLLAVQPLDDQEQALQVIGDWFAAMPGETVALGAVSAAADSAPAPKWFWNRPRPAKITPWRGPPRGFSFSREVQPVLDKYCVNCHGIFSGDQPKKNGFDAAYLALHPFTRRPGTVDAGRAFRPYEYHVSTSELIQLLRAGHHGVKLDEQAWDRLVTWIDLNVPDHGIWGEVGPVPDGFDKLRSEMQKKYAGINDNPETYPVPSPARAKFVLPGVIPEAKPAREDWSFDVAKVKGIPKELKYDLGGGQTLELVLVPAEAPFYLGRFEITNAQYKLFDSAHDSGKFQIFSQLAAVPGLPANGPRQPVVRVSWQEATAFCEWLSKTTGQAFALPDEDRWEWACRAGRSTSMWYGSMSEDCSRFANLADCQLRKLFAPDSPAWLPVMEDMDDGMTVTADVGHYRANPWGLYDMHGNAAEWTASGDAKGGKICRGGSFYDRPYRATAAARRAYAPWQPVFDVGFRVMCEPPQTKQPAP